MADKFYDVYVDGKVVLESAPLENALARYHEAKQRGEGTEIGIRVWRWYMLAQAGMNETVKPRGPRVGQKRRKKAEA